MTEEKLEEARRQLDELATKLGVFVSACGCCGGPTLALSDGTKEASIDYVQIGRDPGNTPHYGAEEGMP